MKNFKVEDSCVLGPDSEIYIKAKEVETDKTYFFKREEHAEKVVYKGDFTVWDVVSVSGDRIIAKNKLGSLIETNKSDFLPYSGIEVTE